MTVPDSTLPQPKRMITTTPLQALSLLNNPFLLDQARALAQRLETEVSSGDAAAGSTGHTGSRLATLRRRKNRALPWR